MMSEEKYNTQEMDGTDYLPSTKNNRKRLLSAIENTKKGEFVEFESIKALKKHYAI